MKNQSVAVRPIPASGSQPFSISPEKILGAIADVVFVIDLQGIFRYVSPACQTLFGYSASEMTGACFLDFIHPADIDKTIQVVAERTPDCRTSDFENQYIKKDGSVIPVFWSGRWDESDHLLYCVARDGTEKCELEQRLIKAQTMARIANYEYDLENDCYTYTSDTMFEIFGVDRRKHPQFTPSLFWSLVHPDDLEAVKRNIAGNGPTYEPTMEYRILCPDGRIVYISRQREVICNTDGKPVKAIGTIRDITDDKIRALALKQSEERLRSLVQNGNDLVGIIDPQGNYIFVGANVKEHLGFSDVEMVGKSALDYIHPDDVGQVQEALQLVVGQTRSTIAPFRFLNSRGEWRWIEVTVSNHLLNPAIGGLVVNSKDITEKKQREDALRLSKQRFKALVQNGSDLIVIIDDTARLTYCSDNVLSVLGYTPEEMAGCCAFDFIHPKDHQKVANEIQAVLRRDGTAGGVQHRFLHKNGTWVWLESRGTDHQLTQSIHGILVNSRNITDRVMLQKRLNREQLNKQKEITAAVIKAQETERSQLGLELHDNVNQILTTVKLYNEMYLTGYVKDKELLTKAAQYTQDCINEIRSISKRLSAPTLGRISLQDSVRELVDSVNLTRRIEIIYVPQGLHNCCLSQDLHLAVYRVVQEALNNIIKYSQAKLASIILKRTHGKLCLTISDDGKGFDPSAKRKGIGITNMMIRAENLHGEFHLRTAPGKGCEIEICFPCNGCPLGEQEASATW